MSTKIVSTQLDNYCNLIDQRGRIQTKPKRSNPNIEIVEIVYNYFNFNFIKSSPTQFGGGAFRTYTDD